MTIESGRSKRKITSPPPPQQLANLICTKKLRSSFPRRRRSLFSPIVIHRNRKNNSDIPLCFSSNPVSVSISVNSVCDEISCNTTRDSIAAAGAGNRNDEFRRVTRSYSKKKEIEREWMIRGEAEVLESSCVESCSIADAELRKKDDIARGDSFVRNGVVARQVDENEVSGVMSAAPNSASTIEQSNAKRLEAGDSVLACSESLADDEDLECTSSAFSEFQSEVLFEELDTDFLSDSSIWTDNSGSQFSLNSAGDSIPSPCVILFKQYRLQFNRLNTQSLNEVQSSVLDEFADEFVYWRFENEDDEQSYQRLRSRERKRELKMDDYVALYTSTTEYGVLIHEQRLLMVNWIVETSDTKELHGETTFLAIRLLDRFLSKGFFTSRRNLEIVGIACLTLATRIEEKQPYNCVLQKIFHVKENIYGRTEVVAMEWLIQEELKFQCLSPTTYNFLWFYLKAAAADEEMENVAERLAELAMCDHKLVQFWPSSVAAGIVMLVSLAANQDQSCQRVMEAHLRTTIDDLPECNKRLEWLVKYV